MLSTVVRVLFDLSVWALPISTVANVSKNNTVMAQGRAAPYLSRRVAIVGRLLWDSQFLKIGRRTRPHKHMRASTCGRDSFQRFRGFDKVHVGVDTAGRWRSE